MTLNNEKGDFSMARAPPISRNILAAADRGGFLMPKYNYGGNNMESLSSAVDTLQTLVVALGAGLAMWGRCQSSGGVWVGQPRARMLIVNNEEAHTTKGHEQSTPYLLYKEHGEKDRTAREFMLYCFQKKRDKWISDKEYIVLKEVILSHDSEAKLYLVPDEVADNLEKYCWEFSAEWLWHSPNAKKYHMDTNGVDGVCFGAPDFIDYLNEWAFPAEPSVLVKGLGFYGYAEEFPETYRDYPHHNF